MTDNELLTLRTRVIASKSASQCRIRGYRDVIEGGLSVQPSVGHLSSDPLVHDTHLFYLKMGHSEAINGT